jgi:thiol peroxidase
MRNRVFHKGRELILAGRDLEAGDPAPDFTVVSGSLADVRCSDLKGKIRVVTFFPSVDTSVCADQVREFNRRVRSAVSR